jgi:DNA-binding CsgD family transcriptional regulator
VLAAPEGYNRLFVDEGAPRRALLRLASVRGIVPEYVATLLAAFGEQHTADLPLPSPRSSVLLEPLTGREREVLRLLLAGASNHEIARRLVLSVNTVKRHVHNLCGKLGAQSRALLVPSAQNKRGRGAQQQREASDLGTGTGKRRMGTRREVGPIVEGTKAISRLPRPFLGSA